MSISVQATTNANGDLLIRFYTACKASEEPNTIIIRRGVHKDLSISPSSQIVKMEQLIEALRKEIARIEKQAALKYTVCENCDVFHSCPFPKVKAKLEGCAKFVPPPEIVRACYDLCIAGNPENPLMVNVEKA